MLELAVALGRGVHFAAVLSLFGTLIIAAIIAPAALRDVSSDTAQDLRRRLTTLLRGRALVALLVGGLWLLAQAADMAGASSLIGAIRATPIALFDTQFGQALLVRAVAVLAAVTLAGRLTRRRFVVA